MKFYRIKATVKGKNETSYCAGEDAAREAILELLPSASHITVKAISQATYVRATRPNE